MLGAAVSLAVLQFPKTCIGVSLPTALICRCLMIGEMNPAAGAR